MIYLTSDQHFGHEKIIKYCGRPFRNLKEMEKTIIDNHNSIVTDEDDVYHLGDFAFTSRSNTDRLASIISKLKGRNHLILGNHDCLRPFTYVDIGFLGVHTSLELNGYILNHDPCVACIGPSKKFIVGHVHNLYKKVNNTVNVGVDVWDFTPVSIDEINGLFDDMEPFYSDMGV